MELFCKINLTKNRYSVGIYLLKVNNRNNRTRCEICSKLPIKKPERRHLRRSGVFIVKFEHISRCYSVSIVNFEYVNPKRWLFSQESSIKDAWQGHTYSSWQKLTMHKKWSFPLRISSVNVTKSAGICGFGHIYWRNP